MEGDGLAGAVFRCIQEMDIDNRMSVSTNKETCFISGVAHPAFYFRDLSV